MKQTRQVEMTEPASPTDGRTLRRTRNRTSVITALLDMIREGDLHPAAAEIADRAGVSHRSIFRYFDDLDDLVRTAIDRAFSDAAHLARVPEIGVGTLDERIATLVDARLTLYRSVDGAMQLARMRAYSIPSIDEEIAGFAETFRRQLGEHFAPELAVHGHPAREFVVDAALVQTGYEAFSIHLRLLGSSHERMRAAWITGLATLLSP
jgi:TetR/AcrR family transcriptional regulator, regulator of autoinduction and epiphytic fitness